MTEEQAIEILKEIQETNRAWLIRTTEATCEKIYLRNIEAIETVLNMLKEKDKEIEKKDKQIDLMSEHIANSAIIVCEDGEILIEEEFLLSLIANNIEIF